MRTLRLLLVVFMAVVITLCAGGMVSAADSRQGGGHSGGNYRSSGHQSSRSGGYYRSGARQSGHSGGYYRSGGNHRGGHGRSSFDFGVVIGGPYWGASWYYPYYNPYYYPYYYPYAPAVTEPSMPQEYIERSQEESTTWDVWYYCPESNAYYPYVKECPGGWQTVPAEPPSGSER